MIANIRNLVDIVPRLNIFGDDDLARLCEQVKDKIASVEPDSLRPSKTFDPVALGTRQARRRRADGEVRGLLRAAARACAEGRLMSARVHSESALRVSDCVTELLRKQPFFGSLVLRLPLRPDPSRETLATDGHEIRYSPRWVAETDSHLIETAMARVVMACALKHHTRRGERDPERWQMASQLVTHALLRDAGFTLPPDAEAWEEVSVEQAYDRLPEPQDGDDGDDGTTPQDAGAAGAAGQPSPEDGSADPDDPSDSAADGRSQDEGDQDEDDRDEGGPGEDGASDAPPSHDPSGTGEVMDGRRPRARRRRFRRGAGRHHRRGASLGRGHAPGAQHCPRRGQGAGPGRGDGPRRPRQHAGLAHAAAPLHDRYGQTRLHLEPAEPPVHRLGPVPAGDAFRSDGDDRGLPRYLGKHLQLPRHPRELLDRGVRDRTRAQPRAGSSSFRSTLEFTDVAEYASQDLPEELEAKGGAGTDFRPGFAWLEAEGIEPACCLYFTDMECSSYPEAEPPFDVLWANYGPPPSEWNREPWGERIDIAV